MDIRGYEVVEILTVSRIVLLISSTTIDKMVLEMDIYIIFTQRRRSNRCYHALHPSANLECSRGSAPYECFSVQNTTTAELLWTVDNWFAQSRAFLRACQWACACVHGLRSYLTRDRLRFAWRSGDCLCVSHPQHHATSAFHPNEPDSPSPRAWEARQGCVLQSRA